ncbi:nucleoside phosphorylase domain-containing protein [Aspergillus pseudoustus]|uniref:Nucleoside phosphorylase domain-containing protein n=1 Tax=Aspergillus pseudoustus TaxID=1810923 RepID=A0ABR4IIA5_9EURO
MTTQRRLRHEDYTAGWVCALPIELAAAEEMLDEIHDKLPYILREENLYTLGRVGEHNVVIACLPQMGTSQAAHVAARMWAAFPCIRIGLMVGIGGGVPSIKADIRLGDVVVSKPENDHGGVVQYDCGKSTSAGFQRTGFLNAPPRLLQEAVAQLRAKHLRGSIQFLQYASKFGHLPSFAWEDAGPDVLFDSQYTHIDGPTCKSCDTEKIIKRPARTDYDIHVHYGTIASGNQVMKSALERDRISRDLGGVLCFEMDAGGLMNNFPCLVIRGICDYSDSHKNKGWQGYAAGTASAYAKELLSIVPPVAGPTRRSRAEVDDILDWLPYAMDAPFNSWKRRNDALCLPNTRINTRINVLSKIEEWTSQQDQRSLFWLTGLAGTGKSTIARTVARKCNQKGVLGASFFFSRGGGDVGTAQKFATSIARQLAHQLPVLGEHICDGIQEQQDIATHSIVDQWRRLITQPVSKIQSTSSPPFLVVVIDALDECDNDQDIMIILRLLATAQSDPASIRLRFLLTSRPEVPVRRVFSRLPADRRDKFVLHEMIADTRSESDLKIFFEERLTEIAQNHGFGKDWLDRTTIPELVDRANGLFIWAATACRFIDNEQFADIRLSAILRTHSSANAPQDSLDDIYTTVFTSSISVSYTEHEKSTAYALLRYVLGSIVVLVSPLSAQSIAVLLGVESRQTILTINCASTILAS